MDARISPAPVRKSIRVKASPQHAFEVFTQQMGRWWLPDHHIAPRPFVDVVLEPNAGGRWFERDRAGAECEWGKVLAWEPPDRVLLAWQLNEEWKYDPDFVTELEIRFVADGDGTRVELEHRNMERFGAKAAQVRGSLDSPGGWTGVLTAYSAQVDRQ